MVLSLGCPCLFQALRILLLYTSSKFWGSNLGSVTRSLLYLNSLTVESIQTFFVLFRWHTEGHVAWLEFLVSLEVFGILSGDSSSIMVMGLGWFKSGLERLFMGLGFNVSRLLSGLLRAGGWWGCFNYLMNASRRIASFYFFSRNSIALQLNALSSMIGK